MKQCPVCESHKWTDDTYGAVECPQCNSTIKLMAGAITEAPKPFTFQARVGRVDRSRTLVNGKVLCACCGKGFPLSDTLDGVIETEGRHTRVVSVQIGWRLIGDQFCPAMEDRYIPSKIRGQICIPCMTSFGGRQVGKMAPPRDERAESILADVRTNGLPRERDKDPKWAHSKDDYWLRVNSCAARPYDDSQVSDIVLLDRMIKRRPLAWFEPKLAGRRISTAVDSYQGRSTPFIPSETLCRLANEVAALMGSTPVCPVVPDAKRGAVSRTLLRCKVV